MTVATLELPREMMDAAISYAEREHRSVVDFFAEMMRRQYGYGICVLAKNHATDKGRRDRAAAIVDSISGIVHLPSNKSDSDLIADAIMGKYGEIE